MENIENAKKEYVTIDIKNNDHTVTEKLKFALQHCEKYSAVHKKGDGKVIFGLYSMDKALLSDAHPDLKDAKITEKVGDKYVEIDATTKNLIGKTYSAERGDERYAERLAFIAEKNEKSANSATNSDKDEQKAETAETEKKVYIRSTKELIDPLRASGANFKTVIDWKNPVTDANGKVTHKPALNKDGNEIHYYVLPLAELPKAHPDLRNASIYYSLKDFFTKNGTQISDNDRASIGTQYDETLGNKRIAEAEQKKTQRETDVKQNDNNAVYIVSSKRDTVLNNLGTYDDNYGAFKVEKSALAKASNDVKATLANKEIYKSKDDLDAERQMSKAEKEALINTEKLVQKQVKTQKMSR